MERKVREQGSGVTRNGESLRLPDPIIYYLEAGAVTEDHVRRASVLRELCGSALRSKSFSGDVRDKGSAFVDSPEAALAVLSEACPEKVSFYICHMPMPSAAVVNGCRVFAGYVSEHEGRVPRWVAAAFWWLSHAIDGSFSADDLSVTIERWHAS